MKPHKKTETSESRKMHEGDLWPALRDYWHPVAFAEEAGEKPKAVTLLDERIVLCRLGGEVKAFQDLCIHRGTPISLGWVEGDQIVCAYHGWAYNSEGKCTRIPSIPPEHPIPKKACLTAYPCQERYGIVWVCLSEKPRSPIPDFPELEDPSYHNVVRTRIRWQSSAARAVENFLDLSHFPWVHEGILGSREDPLSQEISSERDGEHLEFRIDTPSDALHPEPYERIHEVYRPFTATIRRTEPNGQAEFLLFTCTPNTAKECTRFTLIERNYEPESPETGKVEELHELIVEQDRMIVENQRPEELPLDLAEELHVKGPDTASIEYRKMMKELGVE